MQCPRCNNHVSTDTTVCIHCGAEIGICIKCENFSYFIDIDFSHILERISASILLGILLNYSKVRFRKCAMCKNSVQLCINCGRAFKGMNKCPHCQYSHFVGLYSIIRYLKSKMEGQWVTILVRKTFKLFAKDKVAPVNLGEKPREMKEISNFEERPFKENQMDVSYYRLFDRGIYFSLIDYGAIFCWGKICPFWPFTSGGVVVRNRESLC